MPIPDTCPRPSYRPGRRAARVLLTIALVLGGCLQAVAQPATSADDPVGPDVSAAYHLPAGSLARQRVVALSQDLVLAGEARSHAVVLSGNAWISGQVHGDLIVLGGHAHLTTGAEVGGDVYVLGGRIDAAPGVRIQGRSAAYPQASDVWMSLVEGPSLGAPPRVVIGAKLALLAFWSFVMLLVLSIGRRELVATSEAILEEPFRLFFVGLTGVAALTMTAMFFTAFAGALLGVPLLALVAVAALVMRFWGMVAIFHALGTWLHQRLGRRAPLPMVAATWGLVVLGVAKLVPYLGLWTWSLATFIGIGAVLATKFGRREAWIAL